MGFVHTFSIIYKLLITHKKISATDKFKKYSKLQKCPSNSWLLWQQYIYDGSETQIKMFAIEFLETSWNLVIEVQTVPKLW